MVKVRLLEVSLYAKGPRKGDMCPDVAFHEEMPKIPLKVHVEQHPSSLRPCAMEHGAGKAAKQSGSNTLVVEKLNLQKKQIEKLLFPDGSQSNPEGTM
jgi:hypothetical protein